MAVLVTLVYLAVQVRQGTAALASNRHHEMLEAVNRNSTGPISMDREFAEFVLRGQESPDELDEIDWYRFVNFAYGVYGQWEHAFVSHRRGLVDTEFWLAWDGCRSFSLGRTWVSQVLGTGAIRSYTRLSGLYGRRGVWLASRLNLVNSPG